LSRPDEPVRDEPAAPGESPERAAPSPPERAASAPPGSPSPAPAVRSPPERAASPPSGSPSPAPAAPSPPREPAASRARVSSVSPLRASFPGRWLLAVVVVAILGYITLNSLRTDSPGSRGLAAGATLPPFALPLSTSLCRDHCDANVATRPDQGSAGPRPACTVRGPDILNSCQLAEDGPSVLAFIFAPVARCREQLDVLDAVRAHHPAVYFAAVSVRAAGPATRKLVAAGGWKLPVGYDRDGAVADEYAVVICPTITYTARGGRVAGSTVGPVDAAEVERWVSRIEGS
jgi:hypothetical protein